jgi:dolichol-phosphate mannosyltransferase
MLEALRSERLDIVIGSRFLAGSDFGSMPKFRVGISGFGNWLARLVVKAFDGAVRALSAQGYKILVDIFASSPNPLVFREFAFTFRERLHGQASLTRSSPSSISNFSSTR